jgi:hypothetical protein
MNSENKVIIPLPIPTGRAMLYYISVTPLVVLGIVILIQILAVKDNFVDVISRFIAVFAPSAFFIFARYASGKQRVLIDRDQNTLLIKNGKKISKSYDLASCSRFVVKKLYPYSSGFQKYKLFIEKNDGSVEELFSDDMALAPYGLRWKSFVQEIGAASSKSVQEIAHREGYDGSIVEFKENETSTQYLWILFPLLISAFWALLLSLQPTLRNFFIMGGLSVLISYVAVLIMYFKLRAKAPLGHFEDKLTMSGILFSLATAFAGSYTFFAILFNGIDFLRKLD